MQQKTQSAQVPCAVTTDHQVCFDPLNGDEFLFSVVADRPVDAALAAEDISEAVHLILLRMTRAMDDAGEPLLSQELNTLALLGSMAGALLRACRAGVATQSRNAENVSRHEGGAA
ncbi:TPA: hypothetical protein ACPWE9_003379 [Pseudomonas aeruginosa]|nr:hypothetical protein [Pseudomonas aeruginosa]MBI8274920.1 hypothetical protein [Pseudomonas aeruginosa]MCS7645588.1 hypothetical protein [Pseudomonas aeruginosa]